MAPNGVDSDASDSIEVGQPGKLSKPAVLSGLTGFTVSFSPGEQRHAALTVWERNCCHCL